MQFKMSPIRPVIDHESGAPFRAAAERASDGTSLRAMSDIRNRANHRLNTGTLCLEVLTNLFDQDLFEVAERINPKRSFLFVSTVLGRHIPVRPRDHFRAVAGMVDQIPIELLAGPVLVMGYAETAVGLGAAVARCIHHRDAGSPTSYICTTRHPVSGREWAEFSEGHSHATYHHVMSPKALGVLDFESVTLVLVDDETTTGSTFTALFAKAIESGLKVSRVLLLTLTDWSSGDAERAISRVAPGTHVVAFSLQRGAYRWEQDPHIERPSIPTYDGPNCSLGWAAPEAAGGQLFSTPRLGLKMRDSCLTSLGEVSGLMNGLLNKATSRLPAPCVGEQILVIGTGEHVWGPMLLAERLELDGFDVSFVATTRSPILVGEVIRQKVTFSDHYGLGVPMYLHNVHPQPNARVIIMTETSAEGICPVLRAYLGRGHIVDGDGTISEF